MRQVIIEARKLEKFYGRPGENVIQVIAPTDLAVYSGEILAVLGPSGSGKSTLLRMLTGLSKPSGGEVLWHGSPVSNQAPNVSIVFQSFALFPWLNVLENVEAPLKARGVDEIERRKRGLKILKNGWPGWLRGGVPEGTVRRHETTCRLCACLGGGTRSVVHGRTIFRVRRTHGGKSAQ